MYFGKVKPPQQSVSLNKFAVNGAKTLVEGSVTDQSPGTKNADRVARFPSGVPAVSEDSQEALDGVRVHAAV